VIPDARNPERMGIELEAHPPQRKIQVIVG